MDLAEGTQKAQAIIRVKPPTPPGAGKYQKAGFMLLSEGDVISVLAVWLTPIITGPWGRVETST